MMGFSPCAPLLAALALAVASRSVLLGGLIALIFGLATVISPIILIGLAAGKWASLKEFQGVNRYVGGIFLIILGIIYIAQ